MPVFVACSGAKARDLYEAADDKAIRAGRDQIGLSHRQLAEHNVEKPIADSVPLVLLSIGGNDAFFGVVARACVAPGNCADLGQAFTTYVDEYLPAILREVYGKVLLAYPDVPVAVVPYPVPLTEKKLCSYTTFTAEEHAFLSQFASRLNATIARVVAEQAHRRIHIVDTMPNALLESNRALCSAPSPGDAGVNFFAANGVGGVIEASTNPANWVHNSMHPNELGHDSMGLALRQWLISHPEVRSGQAQVLRTSPPELGSVSTLPQGTRCLSVARDKAAKDPFGALESCTDRWALEQVSRFVLARSPAIVALLAGAWGFALGLIRLSRMAGRKVEPILPWVN